MTTKNVLIRLKKLANYKDLSRMSTVGIRTDKALGIPIPIIRKLAKEIGTNHNLAKELWKTKILEARYLASMIADANKTTEDLINKWVRDFDAWDICDQVCGNLFKNTKYAYKKIKEWHNNKHEFIKRASFGLMAELAFHDKKANNKQFEQFFDLIKKASCDERNYVKKAVNWALRQIGKRNLTLNQKAIKVAHEIAKKDCNTAHWIATNVLRELKSKKVQARINSRTV